MKNKHRYYKKQELNSELEEEEHEAKKWFQEVGKIYYRNVFINNAFLTGC